MTCICSLMKELKKLHQRWQKMQIFHNYRNHSILILAKSIPISLPFHIILLETGIKKIKLTALTWIETTHD
jgi:hypothetical protein